MIRFLALLALLFVACGAVFADNATLNWNSNPETFQTICDSAFPNDFKGYKVYWGTSSRMYNQIVDVGNQTTYVVAGLTSGTYYFAVTAYDACGGESGFSNEVSKTISGTTPPPAGTVSINFQPSSSAQFQSYLVDSGQTFSSGLGYGWVSGVVDSRERISNADYRLNTFVFSTEVAVWQYTISNGNYLISLASGDSEWPQGPHRVKVENTTVINDISTEPNVFVTITDIPITVNDGALTITIGGTSGNTMLNYLLIKSVAGPGAVPVSAPENFKVQ